MARTPKRDQTLFSDEPQRVLDDEQIQDAKQMIGCGWSVANTAKHYGLEEEPFRLQIGLPVWKREPKDTRHWSERGGER